MEGRNSLPAPEFRGGEEPDFSAITPGEVMPDEAVAELVAGGYGRPGITTSLATDVSDPGQPWPLASDWMASLR